MNWYDEFAGAVKANVPLAPLTWFHLGGPAKYFVEPGSLEQLQAILVRLREQEIPLYVLGGGANLLVNDAGVDGAVVRLSSPAFKKYQVDGGTLKVGAGFDVQKLVLECARSGLAGLECLAGIPGSVGGELRMNAGGAFGDIGSSVSTVTVMDTNGQSYTRTRDDLVFEYRKSNITAKFILEATFDLREEDPATITQKIKEIYMYKKNSQPLADKSAGCIFKNPRGLSAGALIDQCGLKGAAVGGAEVSQKHANFIVARPGTSASDVLNLIQTIRERVLQKFDVKLETEVVVW